MNNAINKHAGYRPVITNIDHPIEVYVTQGGRPLQKPDKIQKNTIGINDLLDAFAFLIDTVRQEQNKNELLTEGLKKIW